MLGRQSALVSDSPSQEFPSQWEGELEALPLLNANCMEWIVVSEAPSANPFFANTQLRGYPIFSVNLHSLVNEKVADENFLRENLTAACIAAEEQQINKIVIPLLEKSSVRENSKREKVFSVCAEVAQKYPQISFSFETDLRAAELLPVLERSANFYATYDTGNSTFYGFDHEEEILLLADKINNIHLKDRLLTGPSVAPGEGDTDFDKIFYLLSSLDYKDPFILETFRGPPGEEIDSLSAYIRTFRTLYESYF